MIARLARTLSKLHPIQIAARAPHAVIARALRDVPGARPPRVVDTWPAAPAALVRLANAERARGAKRLARLPARSRLRAYEACYGLELGTDDSVPEGDWSSHVAVEPYPASVRARRIAVALRSGRVGLGGELARAARAVMLQPELHLLGNHLLENGFGLVCAGAATKGVEADLWWNTGARLLAWQLPAQFLADGGHVERSASYHVALLYALLEAIELAEASGRRAPPRWREVASKAATWIRAVTAPDGTYPLLNDAALDAAPTISDVLALGAELGIQAAHVEAELETSGVRVTRVDPTGWLRVDANDACAFFDAGPDADGWQPGHVHADGLSFELWVSGVRTIVDYGVASYEAGAARIATRATRSHNTAELDGLDSCEVWGAFRVGRRGLGRVVACSPEQGAARIELAHDGYAWLPGAPRHERTVLAGARQLVIEDRVVGKGNRPFASRLRVDRSASARVRISGNGEIAESRDVWFAQQGEPRAAIVLEQRISAGDERAVTWRIAW